MNTSKYNTSDLRKLLQKSAFEHLTTYRQNVAPDFVSVAMIVITDFEALYAYKRAIISGVYSCLHRTYTLYGTLLTCPVFC